MKTLLWLDDIRNPFELLPDGSSWLSFSPIEQPFEVIWVKDYNEFVGWISKNGLPSGICYDHDIAMGVAIKARENGMSKRESRKLKQQEKTGLDCAKWLVEYCIDNDLPLPTYNIQSANSDGKENIDTLLKNFLKHQKK